MFLALAEIQALQQSGQQATYYEVSKTIAEDPVIGDFCGTWDQHLKRLISHECAHIFEATARLEPDTRTTFSHRYKVKTCDLAKRKHHNLLWRSIYRDLELSSDINTMPAEFHKTTATGLTFYYRNNTV